MDNRIQTTVMSDTEVYRTIYLATKKGTYVAYIRGKRCQSDADAMREISSSFQFPPYYGENWNAVDECLGDLEWLNLKAVIVIVNDFSQSFGGDVESQLHMIQKWEAMIKSQDEVGVDVEVMLNN